jgi:flagellin
MSSVASISTGALMASNYANKSQKELNNSIARISSGKRTMYGQDPAGQAVADSLNSNSRSWNVAARNAQDGISAAQLVESTLMEIASLAQRLRELGIQADNVDLHSESDIKALDVEAAAIYDAVDAIIEDTKFNGVDLLGFSVKSHAVAVADDGGSIHFKTSNGFTSVSNYNVAAGAEVTADILLGEVATDLGNVAAGMSAFKARQSVAYSASSNLAAAASRIQDTNAALESANLTRMSILNQSAMAMVAQANKATGAFLTIINS